jgi:hypothetical protein
LAMFKVAVRGRVCGNRQLWTLLHGRNWKLTPTGCSYLADGGRQKYTYHSHSQFI